jgi:hypothetical protein
MLNVSVTVNMTTILHTVHNREFFKHIVSKTRSVSVIRCNDENNSSFRNAFFKTTQDDGTWLNNCHVHLVGKTEKKFLIVANIFVCRKLSTWYEHMIQILFIGIYLII